MPHFKSILALLFAVGLLLGACAGPGDPAAAWGPAEAPLLLLAGPELEEDACLAWSEKYPEQLAIARWPEDPESSLAPLLEAYPQAQVVIVAGEQPEADFLARCRDYIGPDKLLVAVAWGEQADLEAMADGSDLALGINYAALPAKAAQQAAELKVPALVCFGAQGAAADIWQQAGAEQGLTVVAVPLPEDYAAAMAEYMAAYGEDCGFVTLDAAQEAAAIEAAVAMGAKYPLNLSPGPQVWSQVSGVELPERPYAQLAEFLDQVKSWVLNEKYLSNHYATWRRPLSYGAVSGALTYGLDWLEGQRDPGRVRQALLNADNCRLEPYQEADGVSRDDCWLLLVNTYVFGSGTNMDCDC